jgi:peptidoglycan/LPS O-acetylase OafA/YrhL
MPREKYYPALDGLRGVAIILVLLYHNFNFLPYFIYGWTGVDLFFVLSGFLITSILLNSVDSKHYLKKFYARRALRILPIYLLSVAIILLLVSAITRFSEQQEYYHQHQLFLWLNMQNWMYIRFSVPVDSMLLFHCWSLSLEEQFYLFWPFLILLARKPNRIQYLLLLLLVAGIVSRVISWQQLGNTDKNFLFQSMTRIDGLCIGSLAATWKSNSNNWFRKFILFCITLIAFHICFFLVTLFFFPYLPHFRFLSYTTIAAVFGIVLAFCIQPDTRFKTLLEIYLLKWFGKISYGLYLYHWPLLVIFKFFFIDDLVAMDITADNAYIIASMGALIAAIFASWISYNYFEKIFLRLKERFA